MFCFSKWLAALSWLLPQIKQDDFNQEQTPLNSVEFLETLKGKDKFADVNHQQLGLAEKNLHLLVENQIELIFPTHPKYPEAYPKSSSPPLALCVLGSLEALSKASLAVVGSRKPLNMSLQWMDFFLSELLERQDLTIISGGARGIDQKAHSIALRANRPTICFLPSGVLNPYPREIHEWAEPILKGGGCVVSPFPPEKEMFKGHFHIRNRLIAALADAVLVVQANRRSGTMLTAQMAVDEGKPVGVLPYFPMEVCGQGSLDLITAGAQMIRDDLDLEIFLNLK